MCIRDRGCTGTRSSQGAICSGAAAVWGRQPGDEDMEEDGRGLGSKSQPFGFLPDTEAALGPAAQFSAHEEDSRRAACPEDFRDSVSHRPNTAAFADTYSAHGIDQGVPSGSD
eukprot:1779140-Karenia_brevis.AAC.1